VAHSAEVQSLLAAASAAGETELNFSWSDSSLGGSEGMRRFMALFNQMYGTNVRATFTPGPSMSDMAGKVAQEVAAGRRASTDILLGTESHYIALLGRGVLEEYDYTLLSPRITPNVVAYGNVGVEIYNTTAGITYNTDLVPPTEVPQRLEDVLHPRWKGKIASTSNAAYFDNVALRPEWGAERMKAYVSRLTEQVGGLLRANESERVISGEFVMLVLSNNHDVHAQQEKGAPLGHVIPPDSAIVKFMHLAVPTNSGHPNLAKLFINMMLSEAGQQTLYDVYTADHYLLPGSRSAAALQDVRSKGVEPLKMDMKFAVDHPEMITISNELQQILRGQRSRGG
jgi:iron(III) transport system substrate-binding protein